MKAKTRNPNSADSASQEKREAPQIDLQSGDWSKVREEYNKKYPLFGSQIHFAIDVIRQSRQRCQTKLVGRHT